MYQILSSSLNLSHEANGVEVIELWEGEPYEVKDLEPDWIWNIEFLTDSRDLPEAIIFPVNWNWQIRWTTNKNINYSGKIKRSPFSENFAGDFLYIEKLPKNIAH
jgi:hypothetical protein